MMVLMKVWDWLSHDDSMVSYGKHIGTCIYCMVSQCAYRLVQTWKIGTDLPMVPNIIIIMMLLVNNYARVMLTYLHVGVPDTQTPVFPFLAGTWFLLL